MNVNYKTIMICAVLGASMQNAWGMNGKELIRIAVALEQLNVTLQKGIAQQAKGNVQAVIVDEGVNLARQVTKDGISGTTSRHTQIPITIITMPL